MTQAVEPSSPAPSEVAVTPTGFGTSSRDILTVAAYGLLAYGIYNIGIVLLSGGGAGAELVINRIAQFVALFPVLFLGPALLFFAQPTARRESGLLHLLVRWLLLVVALSYLAFVPLSFLTHYNFDRTTENAIRRLETSVLKKKTEILNSIANASTPEQFRSALSQFPEVSSVSINPAETPAQIRAAIRAGVEQGTRNQMEQARAERRSRIQILGALVRTTALGSLVCGVAMMSLALRVIPWLEPLGQSIARTGTGLVEGSQKLFRKRPTAARRPGPGQNLQKGLQNLQRSFQRTLRRQAEKRRQKASAKRSSRRR